MTQTQQQADLLKVLQTELEAERLQSDGMAIRIRETFTERAAKFGVTKQALNAWMLERRMPPTAIAEFVHDIDASVDDVKALLEPKRKVAIKI